MNEQPQNLPDVIVALAAACHDVSQTIAGALDPAVSARLAAGTRPYVAIRIKPLSARLCVEADNGETLALGEAAGAELPRAFDAAVAAFVTAELSALTLEAQQEVAAHLKRDTGRLAIIVTPWPFATELFLYIGGVPHLLARVTADEGRIQ